MFIKNQLTIEVWACQSVWAECHRLGSLQTTEIYFSQSLEAGKSKSKVLEDLVTGESLLSAHRPVTSHSGRDEKSFWGFFSTGTNAICEGSILFTYPLSKYQHIDALSFHI